MQNLSVFRKLITSIPIENHSVKVESAFWKPFFGGGELSKIHKKIFGDKSAIEISRSSIFATKNNLEKCSMVLLWGYPKGIQGRQHEDYLLNLQKIANVCSKSENKWKNFYDAMQEIGNLGISTITKLAYFHELKFDKQKAIILDSRIIEILGEKYWREFGSLNDITYARAFKMYPKYLEEMNSISKKLKVKPAQLEFFLIEMGDSFSDFN
jgi:hypothetical protein